MTEPSETKSEESSPTEEVPTAGPSRDKMPAFQTAALVLSGTGFALSLLLQQLHVKTHLYPGEEQFCSVGAALDCASVAASPFSVFLGLPWALWGAVGFLALAAASYFRSRWLLPMAAVAAAASVVLFGLSAILIGSFCLYCEGVHAASLALLVVAYKNRDNLNGTLSDRTQALYVLGLPISTAVVLLIFVPPYWSVFSWKGAPPFPTGTTEDGYHWVGALNPTVTIHEYVNYKCPHCKTGSSRTLEALGQNPDWRLVRHPQPLMNCSPDKNYTCQAERMAFCAGEQGKFWRADRWLFGNVDFQKRFDRKEMVDDLQLDWRQFETCFNGPKSFAFNDRAFEEAKKKGLIRVPSYEVDAPSGVPDALKPLVEKQGAAKKTTRGKTLRDLIEEGKRTD